MVLERLGKIFSSEPESLEVEEERLEETLEERKSSSIEKAAMEASELTGKTSELLERLETSVDELPERTSDDLQVVEDVVENLRRSRLSQLEDLELPENPADHSERLGEFLDRFGDVSRKEAEVIKHVSGSSGEMAEALKDLESHQEELETFLEEEFDPVRARERASELEEEIRDTKEEIRETEQEIAGSGPEELEQELESVKKSLEDLKESERWQQKEKLEERIERLEKENEEKLSGLRRQASRAERGLKKVLYGANNGDLELESSLEPLEKLRDGLVEEVEDPVESLRQARQSAEEAGLLEGPELEKFRESLEELESINEVMEGVDSRREEIERMKEEIDDLGMESRLQELEREKEDLLNRIKNEEQRASQLEEKRDDLERQLDELRRSAEELLEGALDAQVEVLPSDRSQNPSE